MLAKNTLTAAAIIVCLSSAHCVVIGGDADSSTNEGQEFRQELDRLYAMTYSIDNKPKNENNLGKYEKDVDEIQKKWSARNKEYYAHLMVAVCAPLSSGAFKDDRQYELARKYALSALDNRDAIPVILEAELTGFVMTPTMGSDAPKGKDFAVRRRRDVDVRLHAWKRLMDTRDPNWDRNEELPSPNVIASEFGFPGSVAPESIPDATLRAKYEAAQHKNNQKIKAYVEQNFLWRELKVLPKAAESYIIQAYSHPPYNIEELKKSLNEYKVDENTKARILGAVTKNCDKEKK
jgi:hypothetical protein